MAKTYRVRVKAKVELIYEVEADSAAEAKAEAIAMAEAGDLPEEMETDAAAGGIGKATIEKGGE